MAEVDTPTAFRVDVLGPLQLTVDDEAVQVRGSKRRAVLALLALAEGRVVTVDSLLDALWPTDIPDSGRQALQSQVFRLRAQLASASANLQTRPDGYRLELPSGGLDLARARAHLAAGRTLLDRDPAGAYAELQRAHELWRGEVLADLTEFLPIAASVTTCDQLHRDVIDALVGAAIAAGSAAETLALARSSLAEDPLREPAALLLMRSLAAIGSPADALQIGREYRHGLIQATGLDPSPALGRLERDIAGGATGPGVQVVHQISSPATGLIGRASEMAELRAMLATHRLVTVVGPGGVGKTRVATEIARKGGTTVMLAPITDAGAIPHALATSLQLTVERGDVLAACLAVLRDKPGPLMIDNCEHHLAAVRDTVDVILSTCSDLSVLTTSREPLGLAAEHVYRMAPLAVPARGRERVDDPSIALFLERATRLRPSIEAGPEELGTIAAIVRRLDGMPLAIELAAGRLSTFSLDDLLRRLDRSLDLLGGPGLRHDDRHRTLRATIEWSYDLLTVDERAVFRHLAVFADGVDLDTAERMVLDLVPEQDPGGVLARLVDASMIEAHFEGATRYRMLEMLRAFGIDRLTAAGEIFGAQQLFLGWAVDLTDWIGTTMTSEREPVADRALRREQPNLRAAWKLVRGSGNIDAAVAIILSLFEAIGYRDLVEIRDWAEELAADPALADHRRIGAVLGVAAEAAYQRGDYVAAERLARDGVERKDAGNDSWHSMSALAVAELARGAFAQATEHSIAAATLVGASRENWGTAALALAYVGDLTAARTANDRGLAAAVSPTMRSWALYVAGEIESRSGGNELAEQHYLAAIELARNSGATFLVGIATVGLLSVRVATGRVHDALRGYRDVIDYFAGTGNWTHLWVALRNLADLLRRLGDAAVATTLEAAADAAPDAPADGRQPPVVRDSTAPSRATVLAVARQAIERQLRRS